MPWMLIYVFGISFIHSHLTQLIWCDWTDSNRHMLWIDCITIEFWIFFFCGKLSLNINHHICTGTNVTIPYSIRQNYTEMGYSEWWTANRIIFIKNQFWKKYFWLLKAYAQWTYPFDSCVSFSIFKK